MSGENLKSWETENRRINVSRQEVHFVYGEMTGLSLLGESVLEWEDEYLEHYHVRRMTVDSLSKTEFVPASKFQNE